MRSILIFIVLTAFIFTSSVGYSERALTGSDSFGPVKRSERSDPDDIDGGRSGGERDLPLNKEEWERNSNRAEQWFFEDLPRHIGNDLKEAFWNYNHLFLILGGMEAAIILHQEDDSIRDRFQPNRPLGKTFDDVMNIGFHPIVLAGASLTTLGISELLHAKKVAVVSGTMLEALILTETITVGLQFATQRQRPDGSSRGFPSGHTSGAFALASMAEVYYGPWVGIPSFILASLVGVSRIDSDRHFASDVAAGAVLGTLIGLGTAKFHKEEFKDYFLVPTASQNSAGLSLVHIF